MIRFVVEGEPVGKERARKGRGGHWYTPDKTSAYEERVRRAFFIAAGADALWNFRRQPAVCVQVRCFFRNGHHPDPDNVQKLVLDALQGMAYKHDRHIASSNTHGYDPQRPRIEVEIE